MEIHSFNKSLLSTSYVIGNCAGLCGTTVSKVEMIPALKSIQPDAELSNRCAETQNEDPGNPHLFCPWGNLGGPDRVGKNLVQQLWLWAALVGAHWSRAAIKEVACCSDQLWAEWVPHTQAVPWWRVKRSGATCLPGRLHQRPAAELTTCPLCPKASGAVKRVYILSTKEHAEKTNPWLDVRERKGGHQIREPSHGSSSSILHFCLHTSENSVHLFLSLLSGGFKELKHDHSAN